MITSLLRNEPNDPTVPIKTLHSIGKLMLMMVQRISSVRKPQLPSSDSLYMYLSRYYQNHRFFPDTLYDYHRLCKFGRVPEAYCGVGECGTTSDLVKKHLGKKAVIWISDIGIHRSNELRLAVYNHSFVKVNDIIIDPTIRQLFIQTSGPIGKTFSPFTEYLFHQVPPIFIGTMEQLNTLVAHIKQQKEADPLHKDDVFMGNEWHATARPQIDHLSTTRTDELDRIVSWFQR